MNTTFHLDGIGNINLIRNTRSKNLSISIKPFEGVKVNVPRSLSFRDAERFILSKQSWIIRNVKKVKALENGLTVFDHSTQFHTSEHQLVLKTHPANTLRIVIKGEYIFIYYPEHADVKDPRIQTAIRRGIEEGWRLEAKKYLPERTKLLAEKYGFTFNRIFVKNTKSRWGSCSHVNNINLNLHLMRLPQHLCDYIILHELAHTVHKNHGKDFWKLLDRISSGNARQLAKEVGMYRINVW